MLEASPQFLEHYARYAGYPARSGPLSERMVELIYVALDASSTHLFASGLKTHMTRALDVGATQADIFGVLHLVAVQGMSSVCQATAILDELSHTDALPPIDETLQSKIDTIGNAHALALTSLAALDPEYVETALAFIEHGKPVDSLTPAESSLIQTALHACFTAFNPVALRQTIATALRHNVSPAELRQAIQLGAHLSVHGTALGATVYQEISGKDSQAKP